MIQRWQLHFHVFNCFSMPSQRRNYLRIEQIKMCVFRNDLNVEIDDQQLAVDENVEKIHWPPTIHTNIPETFEFEQEWNGNLTEEQEKFLGEIRQLINETRLASLCCESVFSSEISYQLEYL